MMLDLPLMLASNQISVSPFFNVTQSEKKEFEESMNTNDNVHEGGKKYCSIEVEFKHADMPVLGNGKSTFTI